MGQNLCCMRQPPSPDDQPKEGSASLDSNFSTPASSISSKHLIFPDEKKREFSTFGECLMDSPKMKIPQCSSANIHTSGGDQLQADQKLYQKIHPASPDVHMDFFTPRISFSSDKLGALGKVDEEDEEALCGGSISSKSQSGKLKKRVSFKLPEAADIIIFYSPKETLQGISIPSNSS